MKIAKKRGYQIARIAVARKLAVILHRMWVNECDFRWTTKDDDEAMAAEAHERILWQPRGISRRRQGGNRGKQDNDHFKWDIAYPMPVPPCASVQPDNQSAGSLPAFRTLRRMPEVSPQGDEGAGDYDPRRDVWQRNLTRHRSPHGSATSNEPHHVAGTTR